VRETEMLRENWFQEIKTIVNFYNKNINDKEMNKDFFINCE